MKRFLTSPGAFAFAAFTAFYVVAFGLIFGGTWSPDVAAIQPDTGSIFPADAWARVWSDLATARARLLPGDIFALFLSPWAMQEFKYAVALYFAALGVVYYLRGRGLDWLSAYGAGAAYGLMGYTCTLYSAGHYGWFSWLAHGPFAFGLVDRAVRGGKWWHWVWLGAVLAWGALWQPDIWLIFTALTFVYGVWAVIREWQGVLGLKRLGSGVLLTALVAGAVGANNFIEAITGALVGREKQIAETIAASAANQDPAKDDTAAADKAAAERWRFCTSWSLPPEDLVEFIWPRVNGDTSDVNIIALRKRAGWRETTQYTGRLGMPVPGPDGKITRWMPYRQHSLYFGLITILLAIAALIKPSRTNRSEVAFWTAAAVVIVFCALGCFTPFYRLVYALPFGSSLRAPVKFVHLVEFCAAVLAGFGAARILERFHGTKAAVWAVLALLVVNAIDLARIDALYLGPMDVSFQRAPNAAAEKVLKTGGGKVVVAVPPEQGGNLIGESFLVHGVGTADLRKTITALASPGGLAASEASFIFTTAELYSKEPRLSAACRDGRLTVAGAYALHGRKGIMPAVGTQAQAVLLKVTGAVARAEMPPLAMPGYRRALNAVSSLLTVLILLSMAKGLWKCRQ